MLWLYQRVFFGEIKNEENKALPDVNLREILTLAPLIVLCVWIGVYPKPFFEMTAKASEKIVVAVEQARALASRRRAWRRRRPAVPAAGPWSRPPAALAGGK